MRNGSYESRAILTEELGQTGTTGEEETSRGVEIRTELGKGSDFTVLGEVELERTSELLHDLAGDAVYVSECTLMK